MTNHTTISNLNYLIDPAFIVWWFENEKDRKCFSKYYITVVQVEDFIELIQQGNIKNKKHLEIAAPLKNLSNIWRTLEMRLVNCEVSLTLTWSENSLLTKITTQAARTAQKDNLGIPVKWSNKFII